MNICILCYKEFKSPDRGYFCGECATHEAAHGKRIAELETAIARIQNIANDAFDTGEDMEARLLEIYNLASEQGARYDLSREAIQKIIRGD